MICLQEEGRQVWCYPKKLLDIKSLKYWLLKKGVNFGLWIWFVFCIFASLLHCRRRKSPGRKPACPGGEVPHQTCPAVWACIWGEGFREWQVLNCYKWGEIESKVWIDGGHISHPMTRSHLCSRDQSWLVHDLLDFPKDFPSHGSISPQIDPDERPLSLSPS